MLAIVCRSVMLITCLILSYLATTLSTETVPGKYFEHSTRTSCLYYTNTIIKFRKVN